MPPIVDSHLHFWRIGGPGQSWPDASLPRLHRDFLPSDLRAELGGDAIARAVLVQSQPDDRDTDWMLAIDDPIVRAIVGWVDLGDAAAPARIARIAAHPRLRGLRPMLQGIADSAWILQPALDPAIAAMLDHGLRFDALVQPRHLSALVRFAERWPDLPIVIDHGAKPGIATGSLDPWRDGIAALAARPNVWCKLSGLRTEQAPGQDRAALRPYVDHLVTTFRERLMWGSDWPVLRDTGDGYAEWIATARAMAGASDLDRLFAGAARAFYAID